MQSSSTDRTGGKTVVKVAVFLCVVAVWVLLDQLTKSCFSGMEPGAILAGPFAGIFDIRLVHNTGGAWGIFSDSTLGLGAFSLVVCAVYALRGGEDRDDRAVFILIGYLAQLLPWVFISRITFEYHYFACTVFLALALGYLFDRLRERGQMRLVWVCTGVCVVLFALLYPALAGVEVSRTFSTHFLKWLPSWPL